MSVNQTGSGKTIATIVYALHAASFFLGVTALAGVIINYVKLGDVRGTWLESHFRWQIRTFWFSLLWAIIGFLTLFIIIGYIIIILNLVWVIYRIARGWLRLNDNESMYM